MRIEFKFRLFVSKLDDITQLSCWVDGLEPIEMFKRSDSDVVIEHLTEELADLETQTLLKDLTDEPQQFFGRGVLTGYYSGFEIEEWEQQIDEIEILQHETYTIEEFEKAFCMDHNPHGIKIIDKTDN